MDTNLIDSCREARGELERNYSTETSHTDHKKVHISSFNNDEMMLTIHKMCGTFFNLMQFTDKRWKAVRRLYC